MTKWLVLCLQWIALMTACGVILGLAWRLVQEVRKDG